MCDSAAEWSLSVDDMPAIDPSKNKQGSPGVTWPFRHGGLQQPNFSEQHTEDRALAGGAFHQCIGITVAASEAHVCDDASNVTARLFDHSGRKM